LLLAGSGAAVALGGRALAVSDRLGQWPVCWALLVAVALLGASLAAELLSQWQAGLRPQDSGYAAVVYMVSTLQGVFVATLAIMAFFTIARSMTGRLNAVRRGTYDNTLLLWYYAVGQGLIGIAMVHLSPRLL
jgi:cytochrome c oxidase subunit I+III